jgi:hypothetical protein
MKLEAQSRTYGFTLGEIEKLLTEQVEAKADEKVSIQYVIREVGGDPMDRYPGTPTVTEIKVTVSKK